MAQMNKKVKGPGGDRRRSELENDLIGDEVMKNQEMETGRRHVQEGTAFQQNANKANKDLAIKQGFRRRHPNRVLGQFDGVMKTTSTAASAWEQAMLHETKRVDMPKEFKPTGDGDGMVNQVGVVTTALENFKARKGKFSRFHLIGV